MRKKLLAMLLICLCLFGLAACGTDPKTIDYNGKSYEELEQTALSTWENIQALDIAQLEMLLEQVDALSEAEQIALFEAEGNEGAKEQFALFRSWVDISRQVGNYIGVESFSVTKTGKSTNTDLVLEFEKRPVVLSIVYKNRDMSVESTTVDLVYSMGERLEKAALNTLMGMGTVFIMLIVICLIISCFSIIPKLEKKLKDRKAPAAEPVKAEEADDITPLFKDETDELELAAVIAAAIAASTGQSTEDFVVRSIKRR